MIPVFLDTSHVIALLNSSDSYHNKARSLSDMLEKSKRPMVTTSAVLLELGDGFARKGKWRLIARFLEAAERDSQLDIVVVDLPLLRRARELRDARADKDWSLTDCCSFILMSERGIDESLSADRHFQQAGFRPLLLEPV